MKLAAWGNSLAVRIPKCVVETSNLRVGMRVSVRTLDNGTILIIPSEPGGTVKTTLASDEITRPISVW